VLHKSLRALGHICPSDVESIFLAVIGIGDRLTLPAFDVVEEEA
jgi:hypothetical protein